MFNSVSVMKAMELILKLLLATIVASIVAVYIIVATGGALSGIYSITDAELIRQRCPIRLVQPEWVSRQPDILFDWIMAETKARLGLVAILWLSSSSIIVWHHWQNRKRLVEVAGSR